MRFVFVTLIVNDRITIDAVSDKYKAVVLEDLKALGLDGYGKLIEQ